MQVQNSSKLNVSQKMSIEDTLERAYLTWADSVSIKIHPKITVRPARRWMGALDPKQNKDEYEAQLRLLDENCGGISSEFDGQLVQPIEQQQKPAIDPEVSLLSVPLHSTISSLSTEREEEEGFDAWIETVRERSDPKRVEELQIMHERRRSSLGSNKGSSTMLSPVPEPLVPGGLNSMQIVLLRLLFHVGKASRSSFAPWLASLRVFPTYAHAPPCPRRLDGTFIPAMTDTEKSEVRGTSLEGLVRASDELVPMFELIQTLIQDARLFLGQDAFQFDILYPEPAESPNASASEPQGAVNFDLFKRALWMVYRTGYHVNAAKGKFQSIGARMTLPNWSWEHMSKPHDPIYLIPLFECLQPTVSSGPGIAIVRPVRDEVVIPNPRRRRSSTSTDNGANLTLQPWQASPSHSPQHRRSLSDESDAPQEGQPYEPEYSIVRDIILIVQSKHYIYPSQRVSLSGLHHVTNAADMLKIYNTAEYSKFASFAIAPVHVNRAIRFHLGGPDAADPPRKGKGTTAIDEDMYDRARTLLALKGYWPENWDEFQVTNRIIANSNLLTCIIVCLMSRDELNSWARRSTPFDYTYLKEMATSSIDSHAEFASQLLSIVGDILLNVVRFRIEAIPSSHGADAHILGQCDARRRWAIKKVRAELLNRHKQEQEESSSLYACRVPRALSVPPGFSMGPTHSRRISSISVLRKSQSSSSDHRNAKIPEDSPAVPTPSPVLKRKRDDCTSSSLTDTPLPVTPVPISPRADATPPSLPSLPLPVNRLAPAADENNTCIPRAKRRTLTPPQNENKITSANNLNIAPTPIPSSVELPADHSKSSQHLSDAQPTLTAHESSSVPALPAGESQAHVAPSDRNKTNQLSPPPESPLNEPPTDECVVRRRRASSESLVCSLHRENRMLPSPPHSASASRTPSSVSLASYVDLKRAKESLDALMAANKRRRGSNVDDRTESWSSSNKDALPVPDKLGRKRSRADSDDIVYKMSPAKRRCLGGLPHPARAQRRTSQAAPTSSNAGLEMPPFEPFPALRSWYSPVNQIAVAFRLRERQALQNALQVAQQEIASLVNDAQYRAVRYQNLQRSRLAQMEQARLDALLREQHNLHRLRRDPFLPSPRSPIAGTELPQVTALEPHPQHSSNGPSPGMGTPHLLYGVDPTQLQAHLELIQWQLHAANAAAPGHTSPNAPANVPTPDAYSVPASPHLHIQGQAYGVPSFIPYAQAPAFLEGAHIVEDVEGTEYEESLSQYDEEDDGSVWQEDWDTEDGGE